jgi:hypothetical protein
MGELKQAFLHVGEIVSFIDDDRGAVTVRMKDGREFSVIADGAVECWMAIKDVVDPYSDDGPLPARDPFVQFSLRPEN